MNNSSIRREQIDRYLEAVRGGNSEAEEKLWPFVYDELRRLAHNQLRRERKGHTLQPTALVNEAYMKLANSSSRDWLNREHFFNLMARVMRHILVSYARSKRCEKRNGGRMPEEIEPDDIPDTNKEDERLIRLDEALDRLRKLNERQADIVMYRFFAGLTNQEIAELLNISDTTVKREWSHAKTWLTREVKR